jgi:2,4-didehydro-3-deoxy-L-rhamnonate hydrolase
MRLIGFAKNGVRWIGSVVDGSVTPLATVVDYYSSGGDVSAASDAEPVPLTRLTQVPPVPETSRIFCVGINYRSHAVETKAVAGLDEPPVPMIFGRWQSTLVTDGMPVPVPPNEAGLDWEVELAAVLKDEVWGVDEASALDHVIGYTAFNDLSARRKQLETSQFTLGKNADRSGPIGPVLVTADEISDPQALRLVTRVNGETVQDGNTRDMIHSVAKVIAYITDTVTLLPGDVIATGTPAGVGMSLDPQRFLIPGDVVEVEVESIGTVRSSIVRRGES